MLMRWEAGVSFVFIGSAMAIGSGVLLETFAEWLFVMGIGLTAVGWFVVLINAHDW